MMRRTCKLTLTVCVLLVCRAQAEDFRDENGEPLVYKFEEVYLYRTGDDRIWLRQPLMSWGMIGVMAAPATHLSQDLARRFAPLVTDIETLPQDREPYGFREMPAARGAKPVILLRLEATLHELKGNILESEGMDQPGRSSHWRGDWVAEVVSARLVHVEFLTDEWIAAWKRANQALHEVVDASQMAPDQEKRDRLTAAIETGSRCLQKMAAPQSVDHARATVEKVDPKARIVTLFQRGKLNQWRSYFVQCISTLRIQPATPLPPEPKGPPTADVLLECRSPAEFLTRIRDGWGEEGLDSMMIYSGHLSRTLHAWEVGQLSATDYDFVRREANERLESETAWTVKEKQEQLSKPYGREFWGAHLVPADEELLARNLILRAYRVEKVSEADSAIGLRIGDLILTYDYIFYPLGRAVEALVSRALYGGELSVLRVNQILTILVPRKQR